MPRLLSTNAIKEINLLNSSEAWLWLMTLTDPDKPLDATNPQLFVNNNVSIISRLKTYIPFAFAVDMFIDDGDRIPTMGLTVDNVTRELIDEIRLITSPLQVDLELVAASNPDLVEISVPRMTLRDISYTGVSLTGTLMLDDVLNQRFPAERVDPQQYGGLF